MKRLFVFAQATEASATIKKLQARPVPGHLIPIWSEGIQPSLFTCDAGLILLTSVGIHQAQSAVAEQGGNVDEIWNLGLAGALHDHHGIGELLPIAQVSKYVPADLDGHARSLMENTLPSLMLEKEGKTLISSDFPIHDIGHRDRARPSDLVDMEGYGVAFAAHHLGKKCRMWKIVSDFATPGGVALIRKHKQELSEKMAQFLCKQL
ncbi:MAG: hypothetical protein ACKVOH_05300 [Chlamydiales bacterium]